MDSKQLDALAGMVVHTASGRQLDTTDRDALLRLARLGLAVEAAPEAELSSQYLEAWDEFVQVPMLTDSFFITAGHPLANARVRLVRVPAEGGA